ncbi:hypothetical protein SPF06_12840 [Sinomonas sp. JGH33]|uniref:Uncharacterized protein n=1 Tax=Sinomonas terricola TaxID=3110330 RepID=A0ABU5T7F5_9MICC|nr:hypothetical protein [Sinomonas sp. JGH33]MEA5455612.1 hypothetical protein [Sinomonas sp. JGH33]
MPSREPVAWAATTAADLTRGTTRSIVLRLTGTLHQREVTIGQTVPGPFGPAPGGPSDDDGQLPEPHASGGES